MSLTPSEKRLALLLGCDVANCLAAMRALGRKGIPLAVSGAAGGVIAGSRWYRPWPAEAEPEPAATQVALREHLAGAAGADGGVLIPCTDAWVAALARCRPGELGAEFRWSSPAGRAAEVCLDKACFAETLAGLDLARPRTWLTGPGHCRPQASELGGCFVKPRDSGPFYAHFGVKGFRLGDDPRQAEARLAECDAAGLAVVIQELIPGPATAHHFLDGFRDRHGRITGLFARQRLRAQYGALSNSSCLVSIDAGRLVEPARQLARLLEAIGYRGMFSAEFKYDARDARFKFIEVNTRPWGDLGLALSCGVDVVEMAYLDAQDLPVPTAASYRVGQHWVSMMRDRKVGAELARAGELTWMKLARQWLGARFDLFSFSDPRPAWRDLRRRLAARP